jgi:hypothetical protein
LVELICAKSSKLINYPDPGCEPDHSHSGLTSAPP